MCKFAFLTQLHGLIELQHSQLKSISFNDKTSQRFLRAGIEKHVHSITAMSLSPGYSTISNLEMLQERRHISITLDKGKIGSIIIQFSFRSLRLFLII